MKKRSCCKCSSCKCHCHNEAEGFVGRVKLKFYTYPDGTHDVKVVVDRQDDLPDPKENGREFVMMGIMVAQIQDYARKQMSAVDVLLITKKQAEEMKQVVKLEADVDKYQQPLPGFEDKEDDDVRRHLYDD